MSSNLWNVTAETMVKAGNIPIPVTETLIELLKTVMTEEQAKFIQIFTKSLNIDEIRKISDLDEKSLDDMLNTLMHEGVITGIPSRRSGVMVYRLMPPIPGLFEYTLMRGEVNDKTKKQARLFDTLFGELTDLVQNNYDAVTELLKGTPAITRVVPVESQVDSTADIIMPHEEVSKIIDKFDAIAVAHCYCRHEKDLLGEKCQVTDERKNCLFFGQTAQFVIDHEFGEAITKDTAREILDKSEKDGLVHKSFHVNQDVERDEFAICNCCKCCCETFALFYRGGSPQVTMTSHIATVSPEDCTACGDCADLCPMEALSLGDESVELDESRCIGCGVCAYNCPADALSLKNIGLKKVFVPPPRLSKTG